LSTYVLPPFTAGLSRRLQ